MNQENLALALIALLAFALALVGLGVDLPVGQILTLFEAHSRDAAVVVALALTLYVLLQLKR